MAKFTKFGYWCQKVLPLVYDESLSYYEVLCKLTQGLETLASDFDGFQSQIDALGLRQDEVEQAFAGLKTFVETQIGDMYELLEKIKNGEYVDLYLESIKNYIDQNLKELVKEIVTYVSFGINADGYFVAFIPEEWAFLGFDTVPWGQPLEGHLVLNW